MPSQSHPAPRTPLPRIGPHDPGEMALRNGIRINPAMTKAAARRKEIPTRHVHAASAIQPSVNVQIAISAPRFDKLRPRAELSAFSVAGARSARSRVSNTWLHSEATSSALPTKAIAKPTPPNHLACFGCRRYKPTEPKSRSIPANADALCLQRKIGDATTFENATPFGKNGVRRALTRIVSAPPRASAHPLLRKNESLIIKSLLTNYQEFRSVGRVSRRQADLTRQLPASSYNGPATE
jgi:hypothetical protein